MIDPQTKEGELAFHVHYYYNRNMKLMYSITPVLVIKMNPYVPSFYGETYVGVLHNNKLVCVDPNKLFNSFEEAEQHKETLVSVRKDKEKRYEEADKLRRERENLKQHEVS